MPSPSGNRDPFQHVGDGREEGPSLEQRRADDELGLIDLGKRRVPGSSCSAFPIFGAVPLAICLRAWATASLGTTNESARSPGRRRRQGT